jgi:hypothetical protein
MNRKPFTAIVAPLALWLLTPSCSNDDSAAGKPAGAGGTTSATTSSSGDTGSMTSSTMTGGGGDSTSSGTGTGGTGGDTGAGGSSTGNGGAAGATGGGGSGGSSNIITDVACVMNAFNDFNDCFADSWFLFGCYSKASQDCITNPSGTMCPNQDKTLPMEDQGLVTDEYFKIGGTVDAMYKVTIRVNGITEGKYYEMGTRAAGDAAPANPDELNGIDGFYTGGRPVDFENYNIYRLTVRQPPTTPNMPTSGAEVAHYYLNSMPQNTGANFENHNTFPWGYSHDIVVPGGGVVNYHTADRNCHAIDNCGAMRGGATSMCSPTDGRLIPNEPRAMIPANYLGKPVSQLNLFGGATQPFHSQALHVTVTNVVQM